jgi:hypothetical protein
LRVQPTTLGGQVEEATVEEYGLLHRCDDRYLLWIVVRQLFIRIIGSGMVRGLEAIFGVNGLLFLGHDWGDL